MATAFEMRFTARPDDIDVMGHVNNAVWVRWMEEIATAHWMSLAPQERIAKDRVVVGEEMLGEAHRILVRHRERLQVDG